MTTIQQMHPRYSIGFQGDKATAANAALWSGQEALQEARESWALVKERFGQARGPLDEAGDGEHVARRLAVRLEQRAGKTLGLVSSSACGLWGLDDRNRIFEVESTNGGSEYLTQVRFVAACDLTSGKPVLTMERYGDEYPVSAVVAFFDSYEAAHEFRSR